MPSLGTLWKVLRHTENGTSLSKSRQSVELWIPRNVLITNTAINVQAHDSGPTRFFLPISGILHSGRLLTSPPNKKSLRPYGQTLARLEQHHKCQPYQKFPDEMRDIESASSILGAQRYKTSPSAKVPVPFTCLLQIWLLRVWNLVPSHFPCERLTQVHFFVIGGWILFFSFFPGGMKSRFKEEK